MTAETDTQTDTAISDKKRYSRQAALVPLENMVNKRAVVVGTGAIGRQLALQLTAMGIPSILLIDFDTVEDVNLAAQGFMESDLGLKKVEAVGRLCAAINSTVKIEAMDGRFRRSQVQPDDYIFMAVDKIDVRRFIFDAVKDTVKYIADARMSADVIRVLTYAGEPAELAKYADTLFTAAEAYEGSCTAKSTIYGSNVAAGLMAAQLAKHLRGMPVERDILFNMLCMELVVTQ